MIGFHLNPKCLTIGILWNRVFAAFRKDPDGTVATITTTGIDAWRLRDLAGPTADIRQLTIIDVCLLPCLIIRLTWRGRRVL